MKRRSLSSAEAETLVGKLAFFLGDVNVKKLVKRGAEVFELDGQRVVSVAGFFFVVTDDDVVPVLAESNSSIIEHLASVWVDMGAVPRVASGADVMRPGITRMDVFQSGDVVVVRDTVHSKPLAVGKALTGSIEAYKMEKGKVVKNLHHVDDPAWRLVRQLL